MCVHWCFCCFMIYVIMHSCIHMYHIYMYITCTCMCIYVYYMYMYVHICMYCNMYMYTCVHIYCISNEFCIFCFVCCSQCQHSLDSVTALHTNTPSSTAYACTVFTIYSCTYTYTIHIPIHMLLVPLITQVIIKSKYI